MNARKYIAIAQTSKTSATRYLQDLVEKKIFILSLGGEAYGMN
jgi:Fic family protein